MSRNREIEISGVKIGLAHPPFIIAEMSGNHNQSLDRAIKIVDAAAKNGAHAIKLQTYTADTITIDCRENEFFIGDKSSLWYGKSLYELYQEAYTPWEWHKPIMEHCQKKGIICFSSPFDFTAVDYLEKLDVPAYKIASPELVDIPLIKKVGKTGKPVIMSTGMATENEIMEAVEAVRSAGCKDLILLKCTTSYPASPEQSNLKTLPDLREKFEIETGISDHTMGTAVAIAAVAMGAAVIEKHFTLQRADGGPDSAFSMEPQELKTLVQDTKSAWLALGKIHYGPAGDEKKSLIGRRSLYVVKDMKKGEVFTPENMRSIRPSLGLSPKHYEEILGKKIAKDAKKGTALTWKLVC